MTRSSQPIVDPRHRPIDPRRRGRGSITRPLKALLFVALTIGLIFVLAACSRTLTLSIGLNDPASSRAVQVIDPNVEPLATITGTNPLAMPTLPTPTPGIVDKVLNGITGAGSEVGNFIASADIPHVPCMSLPGSIRTARMKENGQPVCANPNTPTVIPNGDTSKLHCNLVFKRYDSFGAGYKMSEASDEEVAIWRGLTKTQRLEFLGQCQEQGTDGSKNPDSVSSLSPGS